MPALTLWVGSLVTWLGKLFIQRVVIGVTAIAATRKGTNRLIWLVVGQYADRNVLHNWLFWHPQAIA